MERLLGGETPDQLLRYLQGVSFPAKKDDLVHAARQNGAPNDMVALLEGLPATDIRSEQQLLELYPHLV